MRCRYAYFAFLCFPFLFLPLPAPPRPPKVEEKIEEYNAASPGLVMERCEGDAKLFDG